MASHYPIGRVGQPWNAQEKQQWFARQSIQRSYAKEVLSRLENISYTHKTLQYGALPIDEARYPLMAIIPQQRVVGLPDVLITGGVHGYETSGVQGAIDFAFNHLANYAALANIYILPCISPWGYETINRWGPNAIDPNRSFFAGSPSVEAQQVMQYVNSFDIAPVLHIDLHETTDTDNSEFRPALAARDAIEQAVWQIPDGFYVVADTQRPQLAFQQAIIDAVKQVTHIAPSDDSGRIIGVDSTSEGVINYNKAKLHLCAGMTDAAFVTTTEVYPDSAATNAAQCNSAQVTAITAAIDFVLSRQ